MVEIAPDRRNAETNAMTAGAAITLLRHTRPGLKALSIAELATLTEIPQNVLHAAERDEVQLTPHVAHTVLKALVSTPRDEAISDLTAVVLQALHREQTPAWPQWQ
jgi:hypothetical protein